MQYFLNKNILSNIKVLTSLLFMSLAATTTVLAADDEHDAPSIITASPTMSDPYFPYIKRPLLLSLNENQRAAIKERSVHAVNHVPWTLKVKEPDPSGIFSLNDVVVDRIVDPKTGKRYVKLYHGTSSDLTDIFSKGAEAIKFNLAENTALGMGFYLAADMNEAKDYSCTRLGNRKKTNPNISSLLLVVGVLEDDIIKGKLLKPALKGERLSDDTTGEAFDENIYFARNSDRYNQFVFFKKTLPYMKIFDLVHLPNRFGKSLNFRDFDGLPITNTAVDQHKNYQCAY